MNNDNPHQRKMIRLKGYDYSQPGAYFVTIVSWKRQYLFGEVWIDSGPSNEARVVLNGIGDLVDKTWNDLLNHISGIELGSFIVMPNHVHGIITIQELQPLVGAGSEPAQHIPIRLSEIVRQFKTYSAKRINDLRGTPGTQVWQRNYYDHIIRNRDEFSTISNYILDNPRQWADDPENQSFSHCCNHK